MKKRILSLLLAINMCFSLIPMTVFAAPEMAPVQNAADESELTKPEDNSATKIEKEIETEAEADLTADETVKNITLGTSALVGGQASNVYFGNYQQSSAGATEPTTGREGTDWIKSDTATNNSQGPYYYIDPIKWRVLSNADGKLFLLSDQNLDVFQHNTVYSSAEWGRTTMRSWLNGYGANQNEMSVDYTSDNFINSAFSSAEKNNIAITTSGMNTLELVSLLSTEQVRNADYGFTGDDDRESTNTAYVKGGGKISSGAADSYWLCNTKNGATYLVGNDGKVSYIYANYKGGAVRPAINLDTTSVFFTSLWNGKNTDKLGTLSANDRNAKGDYKLTLLDSDRSDFTATQTTTSTTKGGTLEFKYSEEKNGYNEYISAIITDNDGKEVLYYGQLANVAEEIKSDSKKKVTLTIPSEILAGSYKVKLFNEQINGDGKTDFASDFVSFDLTIDSTAALAGSGTEAEPYEIYDITDLEFFRDKVNGNDVNGGNSYSGKFVKLMNNLDLSTKYGDGKSSWTPIGNAEDKPFKGTFDGNGKKIDGLFIKRLNGDKNGIGLFGNVNGGTVKNLTVSGEIDILNDCRFIGGIVGRLTDGKIENCHSMVEIYCKTPYGVNVGGIAGKVFGNSKISNCDYGKSVKANYYVGGIVGSVDGNNVLISNCVNTGAVTSTGSTIGYAGGIVGCGNKVENCYNTGTVTGSADYVGGIAGNVFSTGEVTNCYNAGTLSGNTDNVGGIVGTGNSGQNVENCYYLLDCGYKHTKYGTMINAGTFASGEIAWKLQNGQTDASVQVWGQKLTGTGMQDYPVLTKDGNSRVRKVIFMTSKTTESDPYATVYVNNSDTLLEGDIPTDLTADNYTFEYWSEKIGGEKFSSKTKILSDLTLYAVGREITASSSEEHKAFFRKNQSGVKIDLNDFVSNKSQSEADDFTFELVSGYTLPSGIELTNGKYLSGTPKTVGVYTVKFKVTNNNLSLMSVGEENGSTVLTLKIEIGLEGEGTKESPYLISNFDELKYFRDDVNGGNSYSGSHVALTGDITLKGSWEPIGTLEKPFCGTFDGKRYEISDLNVNLPKDIRVGLFGETAYGCTIKNLGVSGDVKGLNFVGGIVGYSGAATIENCYSKVNVTGAITAGGVVGMNVGKVKNCYGTGTVTTTNSEPNVGGVVGRNFGDDTKETNCYYLEGCNGDGTKFTNSSETAMSAEQFASGEVAWLLQNGQSDTSVQVWGQTLTGNKAESAPVLVLAASETEKSGKKVYKLEFMRKQLGSPDFYTLKEYIKYANSTGLPKEKFPEAPTHADYVFDHWSQTKDVNGKVFDESTTISADMQLYAVGTEVASSVEGKSYTVNGQKGKKLETVKLIDFVNNKTNEEKSFTFTLAKGETLPDGLALENGEITGTPTEAVLKDVKFNLISSNLSLFGGVSDEGTSVTLTFNIGLKGTGETATPYLIEELSDLEYLRDATNAGTDYLVTNGKYFELTADIDMSSVYGDGKKSWTPIGTESNAFSGKFDGKGRAINKLYINSPNDDVGLFGKIKNGEIRNLGVSGNVKGDDHVGGVVGYLFGGTVENCYGSVNVTGNFAVGGVVGRNYGEGTVKNCYNMGTITGNTSCGGVVGETNYDSENINCYYLEGCNSEGTTLDEYYLYETAKTAAEFASGEVAWLLQNGQSDKTVQVWGQGLVETATEGQPSTRDDYPVLTGGSGKKVNKLTFLKKYTGTGSETYETHAVKYANKSLNNSNFPSEPTSDNYTFKNWSQTESKNGAVFDHTTEITSDMKIYAVGYEKTVNEDRYNVTLKKKVKMTDIDLNDYVSNKSGAAKDFTFALKSGSLPEGVTLSGSKISGTPTAVGYRYVNFRYVNNSISLMSLPYEAPTSESLTLMSDDNDGNFWLYFDVELEGSGTQTDPYIIEELADLEYFKDRINKEIEGDTFVSKYFKLTKDIDMSTKYGSRYQAGSWIHTVWTSIATFEGTFDGGNRKISGLYQYSDSKSRRGLFDKNSGTIKNLGVDGTVNGNDYVGSIAAENHGIIDHCYSNCDVSGKVNVGGIVGCNKYDGTIINCYNTGKVSEVDYTGGGVQAGGIAGMNTGTIKNCYNVGQIDFGIDGTGGGIVGGNYNDGTVENCYFLGNITHGNNHGEAKTAAEFASGEVAWLLQDAQTAPAESPESVVPQVWGQKIQNTAAEGETENNDKYPVLTSEAEKKVYRVRLEANTAYKQYGNDDSYTVYKYVYGNKNDKVDLPAYKDAENDVNTRNYGAYFYGWSTKKEDASAVVNSTDYTITEETILHSIWNVVTFDVSGTNHTYLADNPRTITITPLINGKADETKLKADDFVVRYYRVDENSINLASVSPVGNAVEIGKYLYVINFRNYGNFENSGRYFHVGENAFFNEKRYFSQREYDLSSKAIPNVSSFDNIGFMYITSGAETAQQPIYFDELAVNATMTDTVKNELTNNNPGSTTSFRSTKPSVATVDKDGKVTIKGVGTTVIIATSSKKDASDVFASYTLNVTKEVVTVTAGNQSMTYGDDFSKLSNTYTLSNAEAADEITGTAVYTTDYKVQNGVGKYEISVSGLESEKYELEFKSGTLTVGKKTLTAGDFTVTAEGKAYDGKTTATVNAVVKADSLEDEDVVNVIVSGRFDKADAGKRTVSYSITGLSGQDSSNYVLSDTITGTIENVEITKAIVTVSVPKTTTYVYDGEAKSVNAIGYANGMYFDSFKVKYQKYNENKTDVVGDKLSSVTEVGEYKVFVEITNDNYMLSETDVIDASLKIKSAQQDYFTIEGISDTVTYGDTLELQTAGAIEGGKVEYTLTEGASIAHFDEENPNKLIITGTGKVTVKATSTKANYEPKTASRSFTVSQKTVTVTAKATTPREYDGTKNAPVVLTLDGVLEADKDYVAVTCKSSTVATADVENDKTVFVNGITLSGTKAANYRLYSTTLQTSVNIGKKLITGVTIEVADKVYDGTTEVKSYKVKALNGVIEADKDFVTLTAKAKFEDANAGKDKGVIFSDYALSGVKSGNYEIAFTNSPEFTANIEKATVSLEFGTLSYVFDETKDRTVPITASVDGKSFDKFTVTYGGAASQKNVGKYAIEIALNEEIKDNYTLNYPETKYLEIVKADQTEMTITGLPGTVSYGKTFTLQVVGGRNDITTVWSSTNENLAKVDALGNVTITGATGDAVTIKATKNATDNYTKQEASITFVPTKQAATFKITNLKQTYDGAEKPVTIETNASEFNDDGTKKTDYYTVAYASEDGTALTGAPINAGTYYVTVTATGNYEGEQHATLIIEKAESPREYDIIISEDIVYGDEYTVTPVMKIIGGATAGTSVGNTFEFVPLEDVTVTYKGASLAGEQTEKPKNAGTYFALITVSDKNYKDVTVEKEFTIGKKTLKASVDTAKSKLTRAYGEIDGEIIVKLTGFAYDETESVILLKPAAKTTANVYSVPGTYPITISGGYDENYDFEYDTEGKITVNALEGGYFRISGGNPSPYVGNQFDLTAYVNDWTADVIWSIKNNDNSVATVDENGRVTIVGEGTATVLATLNDVRFKATEPAEFTLNAIRLPEIQKNIYFAENLVEKNMGEKPFTNVLSETSEGATVKYTSGNTSVATVDEKTGLVTIVGPGKTTITARADKFNCETVYASYTLIVSKIPFTIKADDVTIIYGEAFDEAKASVNDKTTLDGNFEGTLKFRTDYKTGKGYGEYDITPYGVTSKKYDVEFVSGTLTVEKKVLGAGDFKVTVSDKVYDGKTTAEITAVLDTNKVKPIGTDKLSFTVKGAYESGDAGTKKVTYSITDITGKGAENYVLEGTEELTTEAENGITKCPVDFFVSEKTERTYDGKAQSVEITATANGKYFDKKNYTVYYTPKDDVKTVTEPVNIGTYIVSVALNDNDFTKNYEANDVDAVLVIGLDGEDTLTITGTKKNVTVGDEIKLYAHYGNRVAKVEWNIKSGAEFAEIDKDSGELKIKKSGTVTVIAKMTDPNYDGIEAEITLTAAKKKINLAVLPDELTKTYNGEEQYIKFTSADVELYDENDKIEIEVYYVKDGKRTDSLKDAGTYAVYYKVNDERYYDEDNLSVTVEKATVTVSAKSIEKEYGEDPVYGLEVSDNVKGIDEETMLELVEFKSLGEPKTAGVGTYPIEVTLKKASDDNCNYVVDEENNGKLTVTPATLTVTVEDVTRVYGEQNPGEIKYEITGFKNDDEKTVKVTVTPKYLEEKIEEKAGTNTDAVEAIVTCDSDNYVIKIVYREGEAADLIITKIPVKATAVSARISALTVKLDKVISGLGKDNFKVTDSENNPVELKEVTVANDGKTYTLKGSFKAGTEYTVTPTLEGTEADEIYEIVSEPLTMKVSKSAGGGAGGGGGAGSSSTTVTYTVKFETNGAKAIDEVKVAKNAKVQRPADPEREGYEFAGWYADKKFESEYDFDAKVTENITLYAKWEKQEETDDKDDKKDENADDGSKTETGEWKNPFDDVKEGDWFYEHVKYVNENGIMNGMSDTTFEPNADVTRGMFVTVLYRLEGEPPVNKSRPFEDVTADKYYANAVIWAQAEGIVKGISETEFAPDALITREQMAAILYRYAKYKGYDVTQGGMQIREFADYEDISEYAISALTWMVNTGLVNGRDGNRIAPADTASRAEIATVLHRFIETFKAN